ncbi:unnamed protein product [Chrysoparadoxa australica]
MSFRKFWIKPSLVSDWGEAQEERNAHWTVLFLDLILVAGVGACTEPVLKLGEEDPLSRIEAMEVADFILKFSLLYWLWLFFNEFSARIHDESLVGSLYLFLFAFGVSWIGTGCTESVEDGFRSLAMGVCIGRLGLALLWIRPMVYIPRARRHSSIMLAVAFLVLLIVAPVAALPQATPSYARAALWSSVVLDIFTFVPLSWLGSDELPVHVEFADDRLKDGVMVVLGGK